LPLRAPSPIQAIQENAELEQLHVEDWKDKASEDEAVEEAELARVQQEIERLRQEQEAITRRQAVPQHAEARRQHINRERARLAEVQYTIEILRQQEQRQEPLFEQLQDQHNANPPPHLRRISKCIYSWQQLKEKLLLKLQGFQTKLSTEEDFLSCAQYEKEILPNFF
jgi:hypothetical protein